MAMTTYVSFCFFTFLSQHFPDSALPYSLGLNYSKEVSHSLNLYLLSALYVPGLVLGPEVQW